MKTPEEMAEEYVKPYHELAIEEWGDEAEAAIYRDSQIETFLAGYNAARDSILAQFNLLLSSHAETSFNPNHTAWQIFDALKEVQIVKLTPDAVSDALSVEAVQCAQKLLGPKPSHYAIFAPTEESEGPDLQEQVEALQQYMSVAQRKIMALQANVELLLYHNKDKIGELEAVRRMQQTIRGFGSVDE